MTFDEKVQTLHLIKQLCIVTLYKQNNDGIIFVVQILAREFYMHVLILIHVVSKLNPRYHGNGPTLASKNL